MTDHSGKLWTRPGRTLTAAPAATQSVREPQLDATSVAQSTKPRYASRALFHGFPATLIAGVLGCTQQTAYHFKSGIRRPGATALRLWTLYHNGRILGDEWNGWQARDGVLFDPEGHRTTQPMLRAYAYVWQLARELARGDPIATEALDRYAFLATARLERERKKRGTRAAAASTTDAALRSRPTDKLRRGLKLQQRVNEPP